MGAAIVPRWPPHGYGGDNDDDDNNSGNSSPSSSNFETEILIIEDVDDDGNTIVVVDDVYRTLTSTVPSASPLPTAGTTSDPKSLLQKGKTSPTAGATSSPVNSAYSEVVSSPTPASTSSGSNGFPSQTATDAQSAASSIPQKEQEDHKGGAPPIGAMVVAPIAIIAVIVIAFIFWRRRRQARRNRGVAHEKRTPEDGVSRGPPGYNESTNGLLMTPPAAAATPLSARTASNPFANPSAASRANLAASSSASSSQQQPVILNTNMSGGAYFTGIDTSDAVSMASGAAYADGRRSVDVTSLTSADEPPPPYRPRSVPSISRDPSQRSTAARGTGLANDTSTAAAGGATSSRGGRHANGRHDDDDDDNEDDLTPTAETAPMRNPFADPEDDGVSAMSTPVQSPRWRRARAGEAHGDEDSRSMISEFSFEHEHR